MHVAAAVEVLGEKQTLGDCDRALQHPMDQDVVDPNDLFQQPGGVDLGVREAIRCVRM